MEDNREYAVYCGGNPKFWGSLQECEEELKRQTSGISNKMKRYWHIKSPEEIDEIRASKSAYEFSHTHTPKSRSFDRDGDVEYYD